MFAISYDRPADLRAFADRHGITYPLLGDEGSQVIRALGVLDEDLEAHHAVFSVATRAEQQGVAYPMTFVLDERGRVARKVVEENYRVRSSSGWLVADVANAPGDLSGSRIEATGGTSMVTARARLHAPGYFAFQRLRLVLELKVAAGWHVYGPTVPSGYTGLSLGVASEPQGVQAGPVAWPPTRSFRVVGLDEDFAVYDGTIRIAAPLEFRVPRNSGPVKLDLALRFQTCSATDCLPPSEIRLTLEVPEAPAL